jgi:hypothetical protein
MEPGRTFDRTTVFFFVVSEPGPKSDGDAERAPFVNGTTTPRR